MLTAGDLIWPVFVHGGKSRAPVESMPWQFRHSIASLVDAAGEAVGLGIPLIAIFPAVTDLALKDPNGTEATPTPITLIRRTVSAIKQGARCPISASSATSRSIRSRRTLA